MCKKKFRCPYSMALEYMAQGGFMEPEEMAQLEYDFLVLKFCAVYQSCDTCPWFNIQVIVPKLESIDKRFEDFMRGKEEALEYF